MSPPSIRTVLAEAVRRLEARSDTPRLDAELLLAHTLGMSRAALLARLGDPLEVPDTLERFQRLLRRRLANEPVMYLLGETAFYGLTIRVRPPVLIPRPETELLAAAALEHLEPCRADTPPRVLDLCTGSGCVLLAVKHHCPDCTAVGVDISPTAIALARENAERFQLEVPLRTGDLFDPPELRALAPFDLITANPPYVALPEWPTLPPDIRLYEDPGALLGGTDGLDLIRRILRDAPIWLAYGGMLALEIGEGQYPAARDAAESAGFTSIRAMRDLAGTERILTAIKP